MVEPSKSLTSRQKEILALLRRGLTNADICRALNISANTVKVHLANIYKILDVSNRTEAAYINLEERLDQSASDDEIRVAFIGCDSLDESSPAKTFYLSVVESLNCYKIFTIKDGGDVRSPSTYQIKISAASNKENTFFVTLCWESESEILWSFSQQFGDDEDFRRLGIRVAVQLYRRMIYFAAKAYETKKKVSPRWWFASCYANFKIEERCRESYEKIFSELEALTQDENCHIYAACALVSAYYIAISESWVDAGVYSPKIEKLACASMRKDPYSIYSLFMMAVYNIVIGNKHEAIAYLRQVLDSNPLDLRSRRMLAQLYMLVGSDEDALRMLNESTLYISESEAVQYHSIPRAFIYFLQDKLTESKDILKQVLMIHPESPIARLMLIACNCKEGNQEENEGLIQKFFEYHPNFKKSDIELLLKGIPSPKKDSILACFDNVFR